tara:strand:+ start:3173 stop:3382 length:210 start_codon:yes stop_codon:yes gene_type:complete
MAKGTKTIHHGVKVNDDQEVFVRAQSAAPTDADIDNNEVVLHIDEVGNTLSVRLRYSDGTLKTGTVALT